MSKPPYLIDQASNINVQGTNYWYSSGEFYSQGGDEVCGVRYRYDSYPGSKNGVRQSDGWILPTSWTREVHEVRLVPGGGRIDHFINGDTFTIYPQMPMPPSALVRPSYPFDSNLANKAITNALLKLKQKGPNIGVLIGERHQTARLFASNMQRIAEAYRAFRRHNPDDWRKVLKHRPGLRESGLPSSWLEVQYGVKPFVSDVMDAASFCNSLAMQRPPIITVKGAGKSKQFYTATRLPGAGAWQIKASNEVENSAFFRGDYVQDSPLEASLSSLGLTNPFLIAWELLPYSFVADWAFQVGDYISTWDAAFGYKFLSGSLSEMVSCKIKGRNVLQPGRGGHIGGGYAGRWKNFKRTVYVYSPLPSLPVYKDPMSYGHFANAASLVATALQAGESRPRIR